MESATATNFSLSGDIATAEGLKKVVAALESLEKLVVSLKKGKFVLGDKVSIRSTALCFQNHWSQYILSKCY